MVRCFGIYGPLVHKAYRAEVPPRIFKNKKLKLMSKGRGAVTDKRTPPSHTAEKLFCGLLGCDSLQSPGCLARVSK